MVEQSDPNQFLKTWFLRILKASVFIVLVLAFYLIYLDAWVQNRMNGPKWDTPVKVFSRPLQLYSHLFLPKNELVAELKLLGYQSGRSAQEPGKYVERQHSIEIYRREFTFVNGYVTPERLRIGFDGHRVKAVERFAEQSWQPASLISLEPMLISRQRSQSNEDRDIIDLAMVPEWMVDTLLVVEDRDFYHHHGVSPFAILRALWTNLKAGRKVQGGSTLTQQLAKNLLLNDNRKSYTRKIKEIFIALILDYRFSKDDILQAYFNEIYLGQNGSRGIHGFALASKFYFNKPLSELEQHEFALLVAIVKGPSYYNPVRQKERAKQRRDLVLQLMVSENVMDREEYQHFVSLPMQLDVQKSKGKERYPSYLQLVQRELKQLELGADNDSGLMVFTGLDPLLQGRYQTLFAQSVKNLEKQHKKKDINGAVVSVELEDGTISALVGDKHSAIQGFNRALDSNRNIGSLIKPAVYLTALSTPNYHLASVLPDKAIHMKNSQGKEWQPANYDKKTQGEVWLVDALAKSINLPTVHLGLELGINKVDQTLRRLGREKSIPNYPSVLLGAVAMSPLEVAKVFHPIANYGQKIDVSAITHVTDSDGIVMWQKSNQAKEVVDYASSYELGFGLQQVTKTGTAKRLGNYYSKVDYGGKTGTTDDLRDSWFVGFDQNRVTSVWVGKDDNSPVGLTGSQGALSAFIHLQQARKALSVSKPMPNDVALIHVNQETAALMEKDCGKVKGLPIAKHKFAELTECPSLFDWF